MRGTTQKKPNRESKFYVIDSWLIC